MTDTTAAAERFWDDLYSRSQRPDAGNPNTMLVREASPLAPARALDLGCAEGADAVWLAGRGWRVTAVDVSGVALRRAAQHAERAGVADRIDWQQHDLAESFPTGSFELVSAQFLHSYLALPREQILRRAAQAVTPGGVLLIVGHGGAPSWDRDNDVHAGLPDPSQVLAGLALPEGEWTVLVAEEYQHTTTGPDGLPATRLNNVVTLRRRRVG